MTLAESLEAYGHNEENERPNQSDKNRTIL